MELSVLVGAEGEGLIMVLYGIYVYIANWVYLDCGAHACPYKIKSLPQLHHVCLLTHIQ